jgi:hypothetical protein
MVPGVWLDGSSWEAVLPVLERAGLRAHPLTLPGIGEHGRRPVGGPARRALAAVHPAVASGAGDPGKHHFSNCVTIRLALGIMEPNS